MNSVEEIQKGQNVTEDQKKVELINYQAELEHQIKKSADEYQQEFKKLIETDPTLKDKWVNALVNLDRSKIDHMLDFFLRQAKQGNEPDLIVEDFLVTYRKRYQAALQDKLGENQEDDLLVNAWLDFHEESIRKGIEIKIAAGMKRQDAIVAEIASLQKKQSKVKKSGEPIEESIMDPILLELAPPKIEPPKVNPIKKFINAIISNFNNWINKVGGKK